MTNNEKDELMNELNEEIDNRISKNIKNENIKNVLIEICDLNKWKMFLNRTFLIFLMAFISFIVWVFPISLFVAPYYSLTNDNVPTVNVYKLEGETTVRSISEGIENILNEGLVTNFLGVRTWIDNKYYEQKGEIEIYRIATLALENNLARNRGTGGANKSLVQARSDIYADYELPIFTSYNKRLKGTVISMDNYLKELKNDENVDMNQKKAVFIVNSDNLAEVLDKLKQIIQTNLAKKTTFLTEDDKFYLLKGNLISTYRFLKGIDKDFKNKMEDKTSYKENFVPLLKDLEIAIQQNHFVILEMFGHVSKLEKEANVISQKLGELRDKLKNG